MQEIIVSPGVYSYENDQSFIPQGQIQTGLSLIGPSDKGPAFVPTNITSYAQFQSLFGQDANSYSSLAANSYLLAGNNLLFTRVLGNGGWSFSTSKKLAALVSGSKILTVFHPSKNDQANLASLNSSVATGSATSFLLTLSGSQVFKQVSASLIPSNPNYITKVLGTDASFQTGSAYPYLNFSNFVTGSVGATSSVSMSFNTTNITFTSSFAEGYSSAVTPWIVSDAGVRLFRFVTRGDGFKTNRDVKVSIANITTNTDPSVYTKFDVLVRQWNDTDKVPSYLGTPYTALTLNQNDANYLPSAIGDKYATYDSNMGTVVDHGDYPNIDNYIRVEVSDAVKAGSLPANIKIAGFEAVYETIAGFAGFTLPSASLIYSSTASSVYSGFDYANLDNLNYLNPVPLEAGTGSNANFVLPVNDNKFTLPFQGGNDGMNYATIKKIGASIATDGSNLFGFDLSTGTSAGTLAYEKALNILSNSEAYSFDLLTMPGVIEEYHSPLTSYAESMVSSRTDAVYIFDLVGVNDSVLSAVATAAGVDSSYRASYYPWVKIRDINTSKDILVPPSVVVPQAFAYNDGVSAEWFAPAGLNRGGIQGAIDTRVRLTKSDRDALYSGRVNPITKFSNSGVVIFGQKTSQSKSTALDRINVRRLIISLRRYIYNISLSFVFEQNTAATRIKFLNIVNPYLASIVQKQGLYAFKVVMDDSNNTADVIDRNQLVGVIYLQPTKAIEFIQLEFNIQPTGANING